MIAKGGSGPRAENCRVRLFEPTPEGPRISGGWRYQDAIAERLQAAGIGERHALELDPASSAPAEALEDESVLVFDSLLLSLGSPPVWLDDPRCRGRRWLLMHYLPSQDPTLPPGRSEELLAAERLWLAGVDGVLATSEPLAEQFYRTHGIRAAVANPGVDGVFRGARGPRTSRVAELEVLCVGSLTPAKNQLQLARALTVQAAASGRAVRLVLLGDAELDPAYAAEVVAASQSLELELRGLVTTEEVADAMASCDLFVSCSLFESFGMAVAEAVASGCLVLSSDVGAARRFVIEGRNGRLVPPGDMRALEGALADLLGQTREGVHHDRAFERLRVPTWEHTFAVFLSALGVGFEPAGSGEGGTQQYSSCRLPTKRGEFEVGVYHLGDGAREALLISRGALDADEPLLVRIHSECFTAEVLHSLKCDCDAQLQLALDCIDERGRGAVVYLRQEGRGIGLGNKIAAYAQQATGADTVDANLRLGLPVDLRQFSDAAAILVERGVRRVELNTNNPDKVAALVAGGIEVTGVLPSHTVPAPEAVAYLETKARRLGHALETRTAAEVRGTPSLIVFDVDGVLQHDERVDPDAMAVLGDLREAGYRLRFLTNDGINSRRTRLERMAQIGLVLPETELYTAATLGRRLIDARGLAPILPLMGEPALEEFRGVPVSLDAPRAVVVGDWFGHYDPARLAAAHRALETGASLIALHRKKSWPTAGGRHIDLGFWVAGLEYCAGVKAELAAKPAEFAYRAVLEDAGAAPAETLMIADEVDPDLLGAKAFGIETLLLDPSGAGDPSVDGTVRRLDEIAARLLRRR